MHIAYPGPPSAPKVVSAFKDCINLSWSPPANTGGTNILGYNLEKRKKGSNLWGLVNQIDEMIKGYIIIHEILLSVCSWHDIWYHTCDVSYTCLSYTGKGFAVKDVVEGMEYEFRVSAINNSGAGEFSTPSEFVFARDPKSRWTIRNIMTELPYLESMTFLGNNDWLSTVSYRASW